MVAVELPQRIGRGVRFGQPATPPPHWASTTSSASGAWTISAWTCSKDVAHVEYLSLYIYIYVYIYIYTCMHFYLFMHVSVNVLYRFIYLYVYLFVCSWNDNLFMSPKSVEYTRLSVPRAQVGFGFGGRRA